MSTHKRFVFVLALALVAAAVFAGAQPVGLQTDELPD